MKAVFLALALMTGSLAFAQPGPRGDRASKQESELLKDLSAEQIADLKTKQLTLALDLSAKQQQEVRALHLEMAQEKKANPPKRRETKPTPEQAYEFMMARLDKQIEVKNSFKSILNKDQFEKWERVAMRKHANKRKQRNSRRP